MYWVGLPLALAISLFLVPAGARGLRDAGLVRENYRGALLAFPLGAVLATAALVALAPLAFLDDRADLDLLEPELRRWLPYLLGIAFLGFLDDSLGRGEQAATPRGWRGHWAALREGSLSTGAIKAIGASVQANRQSAAPSAPSTFSTRPGRRSSRLKRLVARTRRTTSAT